MTIREDIGYYGVLQAVVTWEGAECLRSYLCQQLRENSVNVVSDHSPSKELLNDYIDPSVILTKDDYWNEEEKDLLLHGTGLPLEDMGFALTAKIIRNCLPKSDDTPQIACNNHERNIQQLIEFHRELYDADTTRMTKEQFDLSWTTLVAILEKLQQPFDNEQYLAIYKKCEKIIRAEEYFELLLQFNQTKRNRLARRRVEHQGHNKALSDSDSDEVSSSDENERVSSFGDDVVDSTERIEMQVINALHFYPEDANNPDLPHLGKLRSIRVLGSGGFGNVWLYEDTYTGEQVAVKQGTHNCKSAIKVLTNEIHILRALKHERIVQYYGARVMVGRFSLLMEYVPNGSLRDKIKDEGYLTERSTKHFTKQILEGITYLHSHLVIHRDVKAANVMLTEMNDIKLADFGLAWQLPRERDYASGRAGTITFLAPEVARGEPYGMKADIWSLGCTIVEMLLGDPPLANVQKDTEKIVWMVANSAPIFILPANISVPLRSFINHIFTLKPDKRPTAKELLKDSIFASNIE